MSFGISAVSIEKDKTVGDWRAVEFAVSIHIPAPHSVEDTKTFFDAALSKASIALAKAAAAEGLLSATHGATETDENGEEVFATTFYLMVKGPSKVRNAGGNA